MIRSVDGYWPAFLPGICAGSSYFNFLPRLCVDSLGRESTIRAGIRAVASGQAEMFSTEFRCRLGDRDLRLHLVAAPCADSAGGLRIAHTEAEAAPEPDSTRAFKMETLGKLAAGVAHDFANVLTLISGYTGILLGRTGAQDDGRRELDEIRTAAERGAAMTGLILDFIRSPETSPAGVHLNMLVTEIVSLLRPVIGENIRLDALLDPAAGEVKMSAAQITRVVMNLVLNARDAMPRGGAIRIRTAISDTVAESGRVALLGRWVLLEVSDNGAGMDRDTLARVFQPFFTTKGRAGTGLGLSSVERIVEQAGGAIRARSEPGRGSAFTVYLPQLTQANAPASLEREGSRQTTRPDRGSETILLVEDEENVRKLLAHLLEARGYRVLEAADGSGALHLFAQHTAAIDLLLTDVMMPGMDGRELARQAVAAKSSLKVIYMSGYPDHVLSGTGPLDASVPLLRKPFSMDKLPALSAKSSTGSAPWGRPGQTIVFLWSAWFSSS